MNTSDDEHAGEGVYQRIKVRLLAQTLPPGQLLQIGVLAAELGVSSTPVREALTRLAAERLIVSAPNKGFFSKMPPEDEIRGLYCVNQALLEAALSRWPRRAGNLDEDACRDGSPVAYVPDMRTEEHVVQRTAQLFVQIALRSELGEFAAIVRNVNDRLHHARLAECIVVEDAREELSKLNTLYAVARRNELKAAIRVYHERRVRLVPVLCKELLARSFLSGQRKSHRRP